MQTKFPSQPCIFAGVSQTSDIISDEVTSYLGDVAVLSAHTLDAFIQLRQLSAVAVQLIMLLSWHL